MKTNMPPPGVGSPPSLPGDGINAAPEDSLPFTEPNWASFKGGGSLPAGVVDLEKAAELEESAIINQIQRCRDESADIRRSLEPSWRKYEANYYAQNGMEEKEDWQASLEVPEVYNKVRSAVAGMQGVLLDAPDFFTVEKAGQYADDHVVNFIQEWLHIVAADTDLIGALLETWESSFLYGTGWLSVGFEEYIDTRPHVVTKPLYEDQQAAMMAAQQGLPTSETVVEVEAIARGRFVLRNISPFNVFADPYAKTFDKARYVVVEELVNEDVLIAGRDAGMYDFDELGAPDSTLTGEREGSISPSAWADDQRPEGGPSRRHKLTTYYGNLYDGDGELAVENWKACIVNGRKLISVGPNPLWSGKFPLVCSTPLPHREKLWGRSLVEADANVQQELTQLTNLILDDIKYSVLGAFMVDESKSDEPGEIDSIEPGRVYRGRDDFVRKLNFTTQSSMAWPVIQHLQSIGDTSTAIGEFTAPGAPTSRGRASATEVQTRSQAGTAYMQQMSRRLELNDVQPTLQLLYEFILQFGGDDANPKLRGLLEQFGGPQLLYDPVARFQLLDQPFSIEVHGISQVMSRESMNAKLQEALSTSQNLGMPPQSQIPIFYAILSNMGLDPQELGYPADEAAMQQMQMQMQMAQDAQNNSAPQGGPANPPSGAAQPPAGAPTPEQLQATPMSGANSDGNQN